MSSTCQSETQPLQVDKVELIKQEEQRESQAKDNEIVFKQGDKGNFYFIIETGRCEIKINNVVKKVLKSGEAFGELALMYNAPRSASVRALGDILINNQIVFLGN